MSRCGFMPQSRTPLLPVREEGRGHRYPTEWDTTWYAVEENVPLGSVEDMTNAVPILKHPVACPVVYAD